MNESTLSVALYASELDDFEVFESVVFDRICAIGRAGTRLAGQAETAAASLHDLGVTPDGTREADPICCEADGTVIALQHARSKRAEVKLAVFYDQKADGAQAVHAAFCQAGRAAPAHPERGRSHPEGSAPRPHCTDRLPQHRGGLHESAA